MEDGRTPLHIAAETGTLQTSYGGWEDTTFQQKQVHCNLDMEDGRTPIHIAAETGTLQPSNGRWEDTSAHCNRNRYIAT